MQAPVDHVPEGQRRLTMGATIVGRAELAVAISPEHQPLVQKLHCDGVGVDLVGARHGMPIAA